MRTTSLLVLCAGAMLVFAGCKRKKTKSKKPSADPVAQPNPSPVDPSEPRPGIRRPTPPKTVDAGPAQPTGPAPRWTWVPSNRYLCTRHGPAAKPVPGEEDKFTYDKPFVLTYPKGKLLRLNVHAQGRDSSGVTYEATGLPKTAKFDANKGRLKWKVDGKPGTKYQVQLIAKSGKGAKEVWPLVLVVATEALAAAWKAGLGNDKPDCETRFQSLSVLLVDLNGDGKKDVLWSYTNIEDGRPTDATTHEVHLFHAGGYAELSGLDLMGESRSSVNVSCAPGGQKLLHVVNDCCAPEIHNFYRVKGTAAIKVGNVHIDDTTGGKQSIRLTKDAQGCIEKLTRTVNGRSTVKRWKNGKYR